MIANNMTPAVPTHPGAILKDELEFRGISQRKLAEEMGIRYTVLNEILNGHRPLTKKTALLFEAVLGIDSEPLLRLQTKYNMLTIKPVRSDEVVPSLKSTQVPTSKKLTQSALLSREAEQLEEKVCNPPVFTEGSQGF